MVDLVKLRKKAKEKRESDASSHAIRSSVAELPPPPEEEPRVVQAVPPPAKAKRDPKREAAEPVVVPVQEAKTAPDVVDPERRDRLEEFKRSAGTRQSTKGEGTELKSDENQVELLTFVIAKEQYAISIEKIVEIIPPQPATRVPNAPQSVVGVISLRGTIVTILDLRKRLGHAPSAAGLDSRIIVVENGGETAGFVVDRVLRVIKTDPTKIESHPVVSPTEQRDHILGVFQQGKSLSIYLDLERLLQD